MVAVMWLEHICTHHPEKISGKRFVGRCDNKPFVDAVNNRHSTFPACAYLLSEIHQLQARFSFDYQLIYIKSKENIGADALSRDDFDDFFHFYVRCPWSVPGGSAEDNAEGEQAYADYLNNGVWATLEDVDAPRTKASRQVRPWALLCKRMGWEVRLFAVGALSVTDHERRVIEHKVMMYAFSLYEDYASATVERYVGDLMALQKVMCGGISYQEMGLTITRVRAMIKVFKRRKPGETHRKVPFLPEYFGQIAAGKTWPRDMLVGTEWAPVVVRHAFAMATLAHEHAFRLAELAKTRIPSVTSRRWMMVGHWIMWKGSEPVTILPDGSPDPADRWEYTHATATDGPSKTDLVGGAHELVSYVPRERSQWLFSWAAHLWDMRMRNPVREVFQDCTPLFRETAAVLPQPTQVMTEVTFWKQMRAMCNQAVPMIMYKKLGNHAFRVDAMNLMVALGAGPMMVAAKGRWKSDCFLVYGRTQKVAMADFTKQMVEFRASGRQY